MKVIGLSCFYHDSAVALIEDGDVVAAAQEERFTRKKHDPRFPFNALTWILAHRGVGINEIDAVVYYENKQKKLARIKETYLNSWPRKFKAYAEAMESQSKKQNFEAIIREVYGYEGYCVESEHHLSHASSAFYPSPFNEAAILTMDGVGEWDTTTFGIGEKTRLSITDSIVYPDSVGLLYSVMTRYCGFKVNSGEYKLMGLAPYGEPVYAELIKNKMIEVQNDGSYQLNRDVFGWFEEFASVEEAVERVFGEKKRKQEDKLSSFYADVAASIQHVTEEIVLKTAYHVKKKTGQKNLCMAGGVALNCVANGKLVREQIFDRVWIQPAAGDAGTALGAALHFYYEKTGLKDRGVHAFSPYLGPSYENEEIETSLVAVGANFEKDKNIIKTAAKYLTEGMIVGWFQGAAEFGPRALGNRSILADPRSEEMQKKLNLKIKFRESFRPFAPSVLEENVAEWFETEQDSPYMLLVADVSSSKRLELEKDVGELSRFDQLNIKTTEIPAVTHVDYSARVQTVSSKRNKKYYDLIKEFKHLTGCPVIVNTSFNVRGEPIVTSPEDAYRCFMRTNMDCLAIGDYVLLKENQTNYEESLDWKNEFVLD